MRTTVWMLCAAVVSISLLSGCAGKPKANLLSVDFKQDQVLRYKLISDRQITVNFDPEHKASKSDEGAVQNMSERLEMTVAFKPVKVDESGFATVEAVFENVNVNRTSMTGKAGGKDAVTFAQGKTAKFSITPSGIITEDAELRSLVENMTKEAFVGGNMGGVKTPEMIQDFVALVWFLWDPVSSVEKPALGVDVNDTWNSKLPAPMTWPSKTVRDTTYTLRQVQDVNNARTAVIDSTYNLGKNWPSNWPFTYKGSFQMQGVFGFLRGYNVMSLAGKGVEHYSITGGKLLDFDQNYEAKVLATMPFALGSPDKTPSPNMTVKQKLSAQLLPESK
jgi:outer membrane murein-binding lipoprotein Lpp